MLSFGFRIFCWYRGFCHRTGSDLLLFLFKVMNRNTSGVWKPITAIPFVRFDALWKATNLTNDKMKGLQNLILSRCRFVVLAPCARRQNE